MKSFDAVALGSCYVDINPEDYPFGSEGVAIETELVGGAYQASAGGSAVNFCRSLSSMGLKTAFVGMAGQDEVGEILAAMLKKDGVEPNLAYRPGLQTNIGFNMTNPAGEQIMCIAGTANPALNPEDIMPILEKLVPNSKVLYVGGCLKLRSFIAGFPQLSRLARANSCDLVVDHGRYVAGVTQEIIKAVQDFALSADYYLPSRDEFCQLWSVASIEEGLRKLYGLAPHLSVVVKDGENGAYYCPDGVPTLVKTVKVRKVVSATGAGDSFNAGLVAALSQGRSLADSISHGCAVAAAKISGHSSF